MHRNFKNKTKNHDYVLNEVNRF